MTLGRPTYEVHCGNIMCTIHKLPHMSDKTEEIVQHKFHATHL